MHYVKLLELVAIKNSLEKTYLHIRLYSEYETELFWEIDSATATNLNNIINCDGNFKYRLSLSATYDKLRDQFASTLTKTYRNISEPIIFDCSLEYKNCLEYIKNSQSVKELTSLPFLFANLPVLSESKPPKSRKQNEVVIAKSLTTTLRWLIAVFSIFLIVFSVSSNHLASKTTIDRTVVIAAQPEITTTTHVNSIIKNNIIQSVTTTANNTDELDESIESSSSIHYIETSNDSITYSIPEGHVALTFDDGPSKYTMAITDILKEYNVGGTFFFLGVNAKKHPDSVRYVVENGYSVGSHSISHADMTKLSIEEQEKELLLSAQILENITQEEIVMFRPPYGGLNEQVTELIHTHQFKTILWNSDPKDWKQNDSESILTYIRETETSGAIIILHESQFLIDVLPDIIEFLQEQDLKIVNLQ